jgi:hypothetical protein
MRPTRLTEHFLLREFEISPTAIALKIDNTVPDELLPNIQRLAAELERVRLVLGGRSIRVNSGYRSMALNRAVKGAPSSAHMRGLAADIVVPGMSPVAICKALIASNVDFQKVIEEGTWTHFQIPEIARTGERKVLTASFTEHGQVHYTNGLTRES